MFSLFSVQMVVQVGQPQTLSLAWLSTRWPISGQSDGQARSKGHIVPLDKFRLLGITKLIWPKIMKQMEALWRVYLWRLVVRLSDLFLSYDNKFNRASFDLFAVVTISDAALERISCFSSFVFSREKSASSI